MIINGLIAVRTFRLDERGCLFSAVSNTKWGENVICSDKVPTINNNAGIHAYLPDKYEAEENNFGIVELSGQIMEHANGVLRAERCRIHKLYFLKNDFSESKLYVNQLIYNVPIVVTNSIEESFKTWLNDNQEILKRNQQILQIFGKLIKDMVNLNVTREEYEIKKQAKKKEGIYTSVWFNTATLNLAASPFRYGVSIAVIHKTKR